MSLTVPWYTNTYKWTDDLRHFFSVWTLDKERPRMNGGDYYRTFKVPRADYNSMKTATKQPAAKTRQLLTGYKWDPKPSKSTSIKMVPGLHTLAIQYGLYTQKGRGGSPTMGEYISNHIIADIREIEKKRMQKKLEETSDHPGKIEPWFFGIIFLSGSSMSSPYRGFDLFNSWNGFFWW